LEEAGKKEQDMEWETEAVGTCSLGIISMSK
jgi:hypothetical protein